ncbi:hypothetical protein K525DRAFT_274924 [Schizophyllum commune Loenen D]|nr:hypothetical protein K525DRAFT_274924 [Schizophyllum commune Loenen D]
MSFTRLEGLKFAVAHAIRYDSAVRSRQFLHDYIKDDKNFGLRSACSRRLPLPLPTIARLASLSRAAPFPYLLAFHRRSYAPPRSRKPQPFVKITPRAGKV